MSVCQLQAQDMSSVEGVVRDAAGNPVANVPVTLVNPVTGTQMTAVTGPDGYYKFADVPAGRYTIRIAGRQVTPGVTPPPVYEREYQVTAPGPVRAEIALAPVPLTDILTATSIPIEMDPAQILKSFTAPESMYLPASNLPLRAGEIYGPLNLSLMSQATYTAVSSARGPSVAGGLPINNSFRINGVDNNNKVYPGPLAYVSNMATEQFTQFTAQPSPVFGHSSGGDFLENTGVGANQWHGSAYYYFNNHSLNATDNWTRRAGYEHDDLGYNQYRLGGSLGFPIVPSKIFGYGNFEWIPTRYTSPLGSYMYAPTDGAFATLAGLPDVSATNLGILEATIGSVPIGPTQRFTTVDGTSIPLGLVQGTYTNKQSQYMGTGALDYVVNTANSVNFRFVNNNLYANPYASSPTIPIASEMDTLALQALGNWTHVFNANTTNDLRAGYNRYTQTFPGTFPIAFPGLPAFPNINIGGESQLLLGPQFGLFDGSAFNTYQLADSVSWVAGPHKIEFGADAMRYISSIGNLSTRRGDYVYSSLDRYLLDLPPDVLAQKAFGANDINDNRWLVAAWLHDNWRIAPNFDLTLGVRYQYATLPVFVSGSGLFPSSTGININEPGVDTNNFSPHAGIAWAPKGQNYFVIRAGFSMMYDNLYSPYNYFRLGQVIPQIGTTVTATSNSNTPGFLANGGIPDPYTVPPIDISPAEADALRSVIAVSQPTPYVMRWNGSVQSRLWSTASLTLQYLGTRAVHQPYVQSLNGPAPAFARNFPVFFTPPSQAELDSLTLTLADIQNAQASGSLTPVAAWGELPVIPNNSVLGLNYGGLTRYNGASAIFNQRFAGGATFFATYTYSHSTSTYTGTPADALFGGFNDESPFDHRQRISGLFMFDLMSLLQPWTGNNKLVGNIFANFNISANYTYQTSSPLSTMEALSPGTLYANNSYRTPIYTVEALTAGTGTPLFNSSGQTVGILATPAPIPYADASFPSTTIGARNAFRLDRVNNLDVSFTKRFAWSDNLGIEFRGAAFNIINHSQYTGVPLNSFGFMNLTPLSALYTPNSGLASGADRFFTNNARAVQLSARIIF